MGDSKYETRAAKRAPTAGPSEDDRFGGTALVPHDVESRILKCDVVDGRTRITIARGKHQGIRAGMDGYIHGIDGVRAEFQLDEVREKTCLAFVDATPDQIRTELRVVLNPKSVPKSRITTAQPTRVIHVSVDAGRTRIVIPRGSTHGVHRETRGHLRSEAGRDGASFTVDEITATQSVAYIGETVDHVNQHREVVFEQATSAIQRRASGSASSVDVHATARAGVATANNRIPHHDTIQRAFGKHDISGVRAQIGGAATTASHALGAEAYAMGSSVAFSREPDLHTAAHEAAHTIQQSRGAVGFQGLGAADDEHERHADAVADAVVAGQSAESLLDRIGESAGPTTVVQRKPEPIIDGRTPAMDRARDAASHGYDASTADPEEQREHRRDLIEQYGMTANWGLHALDDALHRTMTRLDVPEPMRTSDWPAYLDIAIGALMAGTAGALGMWAARAFTDRILNKFVADAVKETISKTLRSKSHSSSRDIEPEAAFQAACQKEIAGIQKQFIHSWADTAASLRRLPPAELEALSTVDLDDAARESLAATVEFQMLTAWTNFVARAFHGGMGKWDPWQPHGRESNTFTRRAIPLRGAAQNPYETPEADRVDPMSRNIEPNRAWGLVDDKQHGAYGTHVGLLEIHLRPNKALCSEPDYGMRLDNVGPAVRAYFRDSGKTVRELPVNKIVRIVSNDRPPSTISAFLITGDGYVRLTSWRSTLDDFKAFAEYAQGLPLSFLGE